MRSLTLGTDTSLAEVTNIDTHGIWVFVSGREYFLSHESFPWFRKAKIEDILNVELHHDVHLYWPALDVDLALDSLENPGKYPLVAET